jgi:hypothetical protein
VQGQGLVTDSDRRLLRLHYLVGSTPPPNEAASLNAYHKSRTVVAGISALISPLGSLSMATIAWQQWTLQTGMDTISASPSPSPMTITVPNLVPALSRSKCSVI